MYDSFFFVFVSYCSLRFVGTLLCKSMCNSGWYVLNL